MQWTNRYNLPKPLYLLITLDLYNKRRGEELAKYCAENGLDPAKVVHFSASDLIKPPRMRVLTKRYWDKLVKDVSQDVFRLLGQAIHYMLREAAIRGELAKDGWLAEQRMFAHLVVDGRTVVVSGEPDIVSPEGELQDYKVCAVYSWMKEAKREWKEQTNTYAWLRSLKGLVTKTLEICYVLRDFNLNETVQEGYPQAGAQMEVLEQWTFEQQQAFVEQRIRLHLAAEGEFDDDLPECTGEEMWEKPEAYAVKRQGNKVASKVLTIAKLKSPPQDGETPADALRREAYTWEAEANAKLKGKEKDRPYSTEHRPGERTRCLRYCDVRGFCSQFQEYASAAFSGSTSRDPVESIE